MNENEEKSTKAVFVPGETEENEKGKVPVLSNSNTFGQVFIEV